MCLVFFKKVRKFDNAGPSFPVDLKNAPAVDGRDGIQAPTAPIASFCLPWLPLIIMHVLCSSVLFMERMIYFLFLCLYQKWESWRLLKKYSSIFNILEKYFVRCEKYFYILICKQNVRRIQSDVILNEVGSFTHSGYCLCGQLCL